MGELRVDVPDVLHKSLKRQALDEGLTLKQLVVNICQSYVQEQGNRTEVIERSGESGSSKRHKN